MLRTATFAAGKATTNISIPIRYDTILEESETLTVSLIPNPNVIILRNGSVTIEDDDGGEFLCHSVSLHKACNLPLVTEIVKYSRLEDVLGDSFLSQPSFQHYKDM